MQKITTFLAFNDRAEEALNFYLAIFKNSKVKSRTKGPGGSLLAASFELEGQEYVVMNGGPHFFEFTDAISLMISCNTQEEIDYYWHGLSAGGEKSRCGWLKDQFGLSWQVTPPALLKMLQDQDREKAGRVMQAMMKMDKIIIKDLEDAYRGE